jgi:hypothetical protein
MFMAAPTIHTSFIGNEWTHYICKGLKEYVYVRRHNKTHEITYSTCGFVWEQLDEPEYVTFTSWVEYELFNMNGGVVL